MIFCKQDLYGNWRYRGKCKDREGEMWNFYTNDKRQLLKFRDSGKLMGMYYVSSVDDSIKKKIIEKMEGE